MKLKYCLLMTVLGFTTVSQAQTKPEETEVWEPKVTKVTPGQRDADPPSDAIVLFGGNNLNEWVNGDDSTKPAGWTVSNGMFTVNKPTGNIRTKRSFTDYQLHIEWKEPKVLNGKGQARGNSGVFLASLGKGGDGEGYELQVLDSYENETYVNGQAASIYKQSPPLVNASRPNDKWQTYDVIWTAPRFNDDGSLKSPAYVTVLHNGVLVQNHTELKGVTRYIGSPDYKMAHGAAPILLQSHGDPSEPISYRNIWIREL